MSQLLEKLAGWKPFRAVVVGDYMLDVMVFGNVDRLANDAPVPVLHVQRVESRAGGSANVCADLVVLKASVAAVGVVGDDDSAKALRAELAKIGVDASGLVTDASRPTTTKRNLIGLAQHRHAQKMFRVDEESKDPISPAIAEKLLAAFDKALAGADVVCIEDYGKGVCTPAFCQAVIKRARAAGKPVFVDPASISDYSRYAGATTITPNRNEAEKAAAVPRPDGAPPESYNEIAAKLVEQLGLEAAVITLDKSGALLLEAGQDPRAVPTVARHVYDVTGAGDMVLASLAAARANDIDWYDSVRFANAAAGLEVEEFGCVPIPLERIHRDLLLRERATRGKLRSWEELAVELAALRSPNGKGKRPEVVLANGCFDVLHAGHVSLLRRAAALGDFLVVAINTDESVRRLKGPTRPIYTAADRAQLLGELECVGAVVIFGEDTPEKLIQTVKPDVLVKGRQYRLEDIPGAAFVQASGGRVELLDVVEGKSTTSTVERIRST
jgi:D-beta-D-heptose 7-phosphate kinase/D-beta-D-heptose 1-phosphate adenosyltransferase